MQCPLCCCQSSLNFEFSRRFSKNNHISNFIKIRPVGADGQTDITKLIVFRNFAKAPNESRAVIIIIIIIITNV